MKKINIPTSIGIIMDGNGTWASDKGLPRIKGHEAGAKALENILEECKNIGIKYLTVFAFSTENWNRPEIEVNGLMNMVRKYFKELDIEKLNREKVRIRVLGNRSDGKIPADILDIINQVEKSTEINNKFHFNIAFNYGGRDEIIKAIKNIPAEKINSLTEEEFSYYLLSKDIPDPDLIIRTGDQQRISNFLLWQSAYSELVFTPVKWPDFDKKVLDYCIEEYLKRTRKFGKVKGE